MKTIAIYIQNRLLSSGVKNAIILSDANVKVEMIPDVQSCIQLCKNSKADILLAELRDYAPLALDDWLNRANKIKQDLPSCKIVLIVDEENFPNSALQAKNAFKYEEIDMFFYSSSGLNYLTDMVSSL